MRSPAPAPPLQRVTAQTVMELRLLLRSGESLLVTFGVPLGILLLFGTTDLLPADSVGADGDTLDFLVPGVLAVAILSTGFVAQAIQTGFERKYYVLKRLGASPLTRPQYLTAKAASVAAVVIAQVVVLLAVAAALGWRPGGSCAACAPPTPLLLPVAVVLGAATFTALGLALAGAVRAELVLAGSNAIYLVLLALSDLVFDLPDAAAPFVVATPSGALGILLRRALGGASGGPALVALVVLVAWGVVGVVVAARTFRWEP